MNTSDRIKTILKQRGLSQKGLAELINAQTGNILKAPEVSLCNSLKNDSFSTVTLKRIAAALDVSLGELLGEDNLGEPSVAPPVKGYIEYDGEIYSFDSLKKLKRLLEKPIFETELLPQKAKEIMRVNKANATSIKKNKLPQSVNLVFRQFEEYDATSQNIISFKTSKDEQDGILLDLGNQCSGYPFEMFGHTFYSSETAYLCGQFSEDQSYERTEVQRELQREKNGFHAKKFIRNANQSLIREDWNEMNAEWMLYVIWCKCNNPDFRKKLMSLPSNCIITEDSTTVEEKTNVFWGTQNQELENARRIVARYTELQCKKKGLRKDQTEVEVRKAVNEIHHIGTFSGGMNYMGKCLMLCREAIKNGTEPPIDYALFRSKEIYLLGEKLTF